MNTVAVKRKKTISARVGSVLIGGGAPVVVQSMTNTPTADARRTARQIVELARAGSEIVRLTVNDETAMKALPEIACILKGEGCAVPLVGDFHFNGHVLLTKHPRAARVLSKYRINPGNMGSWENFERIVRVARDNAVPVRIGVNYGSLGEKYVQERLDRNARLKKPLELSDVVRGAMVECALSSADRAVACGLGQDRIVLSVKMSALQDMVAAYRLLSEKCSLPLHLGLTEAGGGVAGVTASAAALALLLQDGIGDTVRVSLTPGGGLLRTAEVEVCRALLQSLGVRFFSPRIVSCPGCGRTDGRAFEKLAEETRRFVARRAPVWRAKNPLSDRAQIAVMGCVVNGPGESRHADVGISLPGGGESSVAVVFCRGRLLARLEGGDIRKKFFRILDEQIPRIGTEKEP